ncbi:hypothetical protein [Paracidovorax avenae]|uniref:hypothetical protein n=1 Tax=Paracidovorax avenae TaxID=80867 RepID=UPI000FE20731|nr:hypothetical protein [Paracidovorax avenae]
MKGFLITECVSLQASGVSRGPVLKTNVSYSMLAMRSPNCAEGTGMASLSADITFIREPATIVITERGIFPR